MLDDITFHAEVLDVATDADSRRRAVESALALVYRVQDALHKRLKNVYWDAVDGTPDGQLTGALNLVRNVNTHSLVVESAFGELSPSDHLHPGLAVVTGAMMRWSDFGDVEEELEAPRKNQTDRRPYYRAHLSQAAVVPTLRTVVGFYEGLTEDD
ncbi:MULTISPECIES: hypothetical protein [unclassified Microbacterium]|uniref:hypothetical protein n=1 Tax=unclassified Microbacterium TaxID=2609290 RepID=UPI00214D1000|nr:MULTISPECIES: hypothetical protein [unclassified Microbacterium]MCR2809693.1 hypothetical protein [Microbacterium sp. zg.B185]WIM17989.1 hypothetical protein QNO12_10225 [Microbacterium sp. zg-B185]